MSTQFTVKPEHLAKQMRREFPTRNPFDVGAELARTLPSIQASHSSERDAWVEAFVQAWITAR